MKIGIITNNYNAIRNINNKTSNVYLRINFLNKNAYLRLIIKWCRKIFTIKHNYSHLESFSGFFFDGFFYDAAHFFNNISFSKHPWITTFETTAPYFRKEIDEYINADMNFSAIQNKKYISRSIKAIASKSCKKLIALSKCSMNIEMNLISNFPQYEDIIKNKLIQLYPPQELKIFNIDEKPIADNNKIRFMFVGREFYRKGGLEILRCFEMLSRAFNFELVIVSSLINDMPYIFPIQTEIEAKKIIKENNGTWLTYFSELENESVIGLMKSAQVGLLPTYSETFGYSVLEFQACGCPVISTDVRALLEINNNCAGWIIPVGEKKQCGEVLNLRKLIDSKIIEKALTQIVIDIIQDPVSLNLKVTKCIDRIEKQHSPELFKNMLTTLYSS